MKCNACGDACEVCEMLKLIDNLDSADMPMGMYWDEVIEVRDDNNKQCR